MFYSTLIAMFLASCVQGIPEDPRLGSLIWTPAGGFKLMDGGLRQMYDTVAWANYTNHINKTGWGYLEVQTDPAFEDKVQAFAAGYLEGYYTAEQIYQYWVNTVDGYCNGKEEICEKVIEYLESNTRWIKTKIAAHRSKNPYWHQVGLFYDQFEGVVHGYNDWARRTKKTIPRGNIFWMNVFGDLEDLEQVFASRFNLTLERVLGTGSCSALIKLLPGNSELFVAHDTWNSYQSMIRILKRYSFGFHMTDTDHKQQIPGAELTFSSYPGVIYSGDDFTLTSSGLAVLETTIGNSNPALWDFVKPEGQILEGVRATVANRMATNGKEWTKIFTRKNSGTYNNQWMVVDYKKFMPGMSRVKSDLLWVLEQLPGHIRSADMTSVLAKQSYWPSYNSPYFSDIFNMSGNPAMVEKFGNWFTYDKTPRALIFKRDHRSIKDLKSMMKVMRYNNYQKDPLSRCEECDPPFSAENAISARNDLNPKNGTYPFGALGHRSHGGTDMKLTSSAMFKDLRFMSISGPTAEDLPPFQWSQVDFEKDCPHLGQPDLWQFEPIQHVWSMPPKHLKAPSKHPFLDAYFMFFGDTERQN
ncbi:hypothetical protein TCAL_07583 [Tigriopus californicus]|uniref:Phospholipase B-like n=1 Tax=Tigriopus californicus TaxID=6832 RepID=A0A553PMA3_TIGCA|nr:putative phospholipase B-like 2 [Tigriopus californicus]XP_059095419.1 putative phospholipase B-like 2 [Tigriopus californicus]TRY78809.1 hypothetical protein TCAL_07583 [Tigriopus californicus]